MLELSTLKFTVDTSQLKEALDLMRQLGDAQKPLGNPPKGPQGSPRGGAPSESKLKGVERSLERQAIKNKILRGEVVQLKDAQVSLDRAFTSGQAGQLATAKLSGATAEQFKKLAASFRDFNAISGTNPFDKTLGGITKLRSELQELNSVNGLMNNGFNVTREQARLLQRDLNSLAQTMQLAGKSQQEIATASQAHSRAFAEQATILNQQVAVAKESEAMARRDAAAKFTQQKAYKALEVEMQRVDAVMAEMNNEFGLTANTGERAAAAVAKYAVMLKRAGVEGVQAAAMLETYRKKTQQIASQDETRAATRLSRALTPQISDVAVSVAGGMPLHLIIMQQGLQIRDLIAQSGVSQQKMQEVFKTAGADMVRSIGGTIKALGTLVYGTLVDASKAVVNFGMQITPLGSAIDKLAGVSYRAAQAVRAFSIAMVATGIGAFIVGIGAVIAATVSLYKEQGKLNVAMNTTAASLGMTVGQANEYANSMNAAGISGRKVIEALQAIGVEGGFTGKTLDMVVKSAVAFSSATGVAIEDVVKNFAKLRDDPVAAVRSLGKETGYFSDELAINIRKLEEQGNSALAATTALEAYAKGTKESADAIKNNYGVLETVFNGVGKAAGWMWDAILAVGRPESDLGRLKQQADFWNNHLKARPNSKLMQDEAATANAAYQSALALEEQAKQRKRNAETAKLTVFSDKLILDMRSKEEAYQIRMNKLLDEENKLSMAGNLTAERQLAINRARVKAREERDGKPKKQKKPEEPYKWQERLNDAMNTTVAKARELNAVEKAWIDIQDDKKFLLLSETERNKAAAAAVDLIKQANTELAKSKLADYTKQFDEFLAKIEQRNKDSDFTISTAFVINADELTAMKDKYDLQKQYEEFLYEYKIGYERAYLEFAREGQEQQLEQRLKQIAEIYKAEINAANKASDAVKVDRERDKRVKVIEDQKKAYEDMWRSVDNEAERIFIDIAQNGEDAFKRIGESIEEYLLKMLYEMTVKQWIIQVATSNNGGNPISSLSQGNGLSSALGSVGVGGGATLGSMGQYFSTGFTAAGSGAGVSTTAGAGASIGGANGAAMQAGAYAAPVAGAAAGMYANRKISGGYKMDMKYSQEIQDAGVLIATAVGSPLAGVLTGVAQGIQNRVFGRKLTEVGVMGKFNNGQVDSSAYQKQKGGLLRSDKISSSGLDDPTRNALNMQLKAVQESAAGMAKAMGHSAESIENFTGRVRINLKGLNNEEAAKKMADELEKLKIQMLSTIPGIDMTRQQLKQLVVEVQQLMTQAGISVQGMAGIITQGLLGRLSQEQVGEQLAEMVIGGIYTTMISPFATEISTVFSSQILEPMFTAIAAGVPISQAISQASINAVVQKAQEAATAINAVMSDPGFRSAIGSVQKAISRISVAVTRRAVPAFGTAAAEAKRAAEAAAAEAKRAADQVKSEWRQITETITQEIRRIRGELAQEDTRGFAYLQSQFAIATAQARGGDQEAANQLPALSSAMLELAAKQSKSLVELQRLQGYTVASLLETRSYLASKYGIEVPAFAAGGVFTNGVVSSPTLFNTGLMGEAGPEAIMPLASVGGKLGVRTTSDSSSSELIQEVRMLRAEVRAVVSHTSKTAKILTRVTPDGETVAVTVQ